MPSRVGSLPLPERSARTSVLPAKRGLLRRQCACGQHAESEHECEECRSERQALRRVASPGGGQARVPGAVYDVLRTPGRPLDAATRSVMESRLRHDFGRVRVHTDAKAAESARAVGALAYAVGSHVVFGARQYEPETEAGKRLLAHELEHTVQQHRRGRIELQRKTASPCPDPRTPEPDYVWLAREVHEGVEYIWGTDEERVYVALRVLEQDPGRVCKLKQVYQSEYDGADLLEDIRGDFSAGELEYALQLVGLGKRFSEQRVQPAPITYSGYVADARRLHEAAAGPGTDEEAIFAVLTPLAGTAGMRTLEETYLKEYHHKEYHHSIRAMIEDEMDGSERDYALQLLDKPVVAAASVKRDPGPEQQSLEKPVVARWVREAYAKLAEKGMGLVPWWERKRDGSPRWDDRYWVFAAEEAYRKRVHRREDLKLSLRSGVSPHEAVDALFDEQHQWDMDCGQFVQVARLYVERKLRPDDRVFDEWAGPDLTLRTHAPENFRHALFRRISQGGVPEELWLTDPGGRIDRLPEPRMLEMAPSGSRIRWTSSWTIRAADIAQKIHGERALGMGWFAFQHENAIKLGPDSYGAHGLGESGPLRAEKIVESMVDATRSALGAVAGVTVRGEPVSELPANPSDDDIRRHIYVSNIEYYRW